MIRILHWRERLLPPDTASAITLGESSHRPSSSRCIISTDKVLLLKSVDSYAVQYAEELKRRLIDNGPGEVQQSEGQPDYLPFEFMALEVALETVHILLDSQVRDEIEQLMNKDGDMAAMYLTEKKRRGMNFSIPLFDDQGAFEWVLVTTGVTGMCIYAALLWFFRNRRLVQLLVDQ